MKSKEAARRAASSFLLKTAPIYKLFARPFLDNPYLYFSA